MKSLYDILGVPRDATDEQLKSARRSAAARVHPDRPGGSAEAMAQINNAYDVLMDPEARKRYDETGRTDRQDTLRDAVRDMLISVIGQLVDKDMIQDTASVVGTLNQGINEAMQGLTRQLDQMSGKVERMEKKLEKIESKGEASLLLDVMRGKLDELKALKEKLEKSKDVLEAAREELKGYNETVAKTAQPYHELFVRNNSPWP